MEMQIPKPVLRWHAQIKASQHMGKGKGHWFLWERRGVYPIPWYGAPVSDGQ